MLNVVVTGLAAIGFLVCVALGLLFGWMTFRPNVSSVRVKLVCPMSSGFLALMAAGFALIVFHKPAQGFFNLAGFGAIVGVVVVKKWGRL